MTKTPHNLTVGDFEFTSEGVTITLKSSKTVQFAETGKDAGVGDFIFVVSCSLASPGASHIQPLHQCPHFARSLLIQGEGL